MTTTKFLYILCLLSLLFACSPTVNKNLDNYYIVKNPKKEDPNNVFPYIRNKAFGINIPKGYNTHGIDISHHQGDVNWRQVYDLKRGVDSVPLTFIFLKATEGQDLVDKRFKKNWVSTKKHGFIRGAYHYYKPNKSPEVQAKNFIKTVHLEKGDLPPVLDIEELRKVKPEVLKKDLKVWLNIIEKHYGIKPIIYTYASFYNKYLVEANGVSEFEGYPLWIAHYYREKTEVYNWVFWQYSDQANLPGIDYSVDINVFNGSSYELKAMLKTK